MKREQKLITLLAIITIYIVLVPTCILPFFSSYYLNVINPFFWITLFAVTYLFYKDLYIRSKYNRHLGKIVFYITLIYIIIFFLLGLAFGFKISSMSHTPFGIIKNFTSLVVVLLIEEYIRYYLINSFKNKSNIIALITLVFTLFDLVLYFKLIDSMNIYSFIFFLVVPNVLINILCSFLAYKKSLYSTLLIRGMPVIIYILIPVIPNVKLVFMAIIEIVYCITAFIIINNNIRSLNIIENKIKVNKNKRIKFAILVTFTILVMFVIGIFNYVPVSVASESMYPNIKLGDVVIYKKINDMSKLKKGDIIVFIKNNLVIIHRIYSIDMIDSTTYITTKGDNNVLVDDWVVTDEDIIGIYKYKIPYVGYPTALIHKMFGDE